MVKSKYIGLQKSILITEIKSMHIFYGMLIKIQLKKIYHLPSIYLTDIIKLLKLPLKNNFNL
jgi:hypothetical protein